MNVPPHSKAYVALGAILALVATVFSVPAAYAATEDLINVAWGGEINNHVYNTAGAELSYGSLTPLDTTNEPTRLSTVPGLSLQGGSQGMKFVPGEGQSAYFLGSAGGNVTAKFRAEIEFLPHKTTAQTALATIFSAGGNIFLRYKDASTIEWGFSTNVSSKWADFKATTAAPAIAKTHDFQLEHTVSADGNGKLELWIDGVSKGAATSNNGASAKIGSNLERTYAFGNEVNPDASGRGVVGELHRVRIGSLENDWEFVPEESGEVTPTSCDLSSVKTGNWQEVSANDCDELIKAKLSALRPTEKQADWLDHGMIAFMHFGPNTFLNKSWGDGTEDPKVVNPTQLDTDQWAKTYADAGYRMIMVTIKHHDGFLLYDSRYTTHDMGSTLGKQDIVKMYTDSARKYGLKVGMYVSPADSHQEKGGGTYGNGSTAKEVTIPTLVANDDRAARINSGELPSFTYTADEYNTYFMNTLYELLTEYGTVDEVWFDGAKGNTSHPQHYDYTAIYDLIEKLQPGSMIVNSANDARWIGNEQGRSNRAATGEWSGQAGLLNPGPSDKGRFAIKPQETTNDLGSFTNVLTAIRSNGADKLHWDPAEADGKNSSEWFRTANANANRPLSAAYLVKENYEKATGQNSMWLLNVPAGVDGLIEGRYVDQQIAVREEINRRWHTDDLALGKPATVTANGKTLSAPKLVDGSHLTSEVTGSLTPIYEVDLGKSQQIQYIALAEDSRASGQQVEGFTIEAYSAGAWTNVADGVAIGNLRHVTLATPVTAEKLRVSITKARGPVQLSRLEVHRAESALNNPARAYYLDPSATTPGNGTKEAPFNSIDQFRDLTLMPGSVIYVKRGTTVTGEFWGWGYGTADAPIQLSSYGSGAEPVYSVTAQRKTIGTGLTAQQMLEQTGATANGYRAVAQANVVEPKVRAFVPQSQMKATATSAYGSTPASNVLDGRSETIWETNWGNTYKGKFPQSITLDLGKEYPVSALQYVPRFENTGSYEQKNSWAKDYEIYVSNSASETGKKVAEGTFAENETVKRVEFAPTTGQYLTLTIKSAYSSNTTVDTAGAAELNVEYDVPEPVKHTVSFAGDGVSAESYPALIVEDGSATTKPEADPVREGFTFNGWFAEGADKPFDFSAPITTDMLLTAHWTKIEIAPGEDPADPTEPTEPVDPAEPVEPSDPDKDPAELVEPTKPTKPTDPSEPSAQHLSNTGSQTLWAVYASLALVAGGLVLTIRRRYA